jgi:nucleoside-diphosphate-sugar epimerase
VTVVVDPHHVIRQALVTGATGFIGSHLVAALRRRGIPVRALVRASSSRGELDALGVDVVVGDVTAPMSLDAAVAGVDTVFHLAALLKQPWDAGVLPTNADGVRNLVAACAQREHPPVVVLASSVAAVGPSPDGRPMLEGSTPRPVSDYGRSKLAGEHAARPYAATVPITVVRPPAVFGARDTGTLPLFRMAARGLAVVPIGGDYATSLVHVADLVEALVAAAERGERLPAPGAAASADHGIYFVADPRRPTVLELGRLLGRASGRGRVRVVRVPRAVGTAVAALTEGVARLRGVPSIVNRDKMREVHAGAWIVSAEKARRQLGWEAGASLEERLAATAAWYRDAGWL